MPAPMGVWSDSPIIAVTRIVTSRNGKFNMAMTSEDAQDLLLGT